MRRWLFLLLTSILAAPISRAAAPTAPVFSLPIRCTVGVDCQIQNDMDRDPGPGAKDFRCGSRTYQDHRGLDPRLPNMAAEQTGVEVLAAAAGKVLRLRDGTADAPVRQIGQTAVANGECGNGVVIGHDGGWESQYCHMSGGSLKVQVGQSVALGQVLGQVGLSGNTEYPHLHFQVRRGEDIVDPFAPAAGAGASCGGGASLWSPAAAAALAYRDQAVLNAGFAAGQVAMQDIEAGPITPPGIRSPGLVAYVRAIGLKKGDVQVLAERPGRVGPRWGAPPRRSMPTRPSTCCSPASVSLPVRGPREPIGPSIRSGAAGRSCWRRRSSSV